MGRKVNNNDINIKEIVTVKTYTYCIKCGRDFSEPSIDHFCDDYCRSEYYQELAKESDACYREWIGRD